MDPTLLPFALMLGVPLLVAALVFIWLFSRVASVAAFISHVEANPLEGWGRVDVVERSTARYGGQRLLRIQLTVFPSGGAAYGATTRCFQDLSVGTLLAIADRGQRVPVLIRADNPSKVILDTRSERMSREGLVQRSAVEYR
ncbi:hypothetical protein HPC49_07185 [Pyxidicoccus fallax]|uniref:Uncharacterized protein n=1 Tax=Pyxidicoccus fallax TaxID=394095 RepID=A0A848LTI7_9BACT|nr:hypothetical protein [Pyxidicoccus fallax]NMO20940.1 hypothetical protein [Pyxidicoccus fallax]NPC78035.1 hypothetical protein [Pyxidicoccus fallax]